MLDSWEGAVRFQKNRASSMKSGSSRPDAQELADACFRVDISVRGPQWIGNFAYGGGHSPADPPDVRSAGGLLFGIPPSIEAASFAIPRRFPGLSNGRTSQIKVHRLCGIDWRAPLPALVRDAGKPRRIEGAERVLGTDPGETSSKPTHGSRTHSPSRRRFTRSGQYTSQIAVMIDTNWLKVFPRGQ